MKTKTILIKCEVPQDVNLPVKEIYFSDGKKWLKTTYAEIITPPTEEEVETICKRYISNTGYFSAMAAIRDYKQRLGL